MSQDTRPLILDLPPISRAMLSLQGLSCGDSFGESFFLPHAEAIRHITDRSLPPGPWPFTDDTAMALSIVSNLKRFGAIDPEHLARSFSERYDPARGYGPAMHSHLLRLSAIGAAHWHREARSLFNGQGSFGNGAAMRVAPLGAFFADDPDRLMEQATRSAIPTHAHPEAVAGAIAVALAAAFFWNSRNAPAVRPADTLASIAEATPSGLVRSGILQAADLPGSASPQAAAALLGNGSKVSAADTVPFALWCAATNPDSYEEALWRTVSGLGDRDTTCAIVGGIVILRTGMESLPKAWLARAESPWPMLH